MSEQTARDRVKVYCAGPLFNPAERREMTEIADVLVDDGFDVYLPHRDGMEFRLILDVLERRGWPHDLAGRFLHSAIFALDVYQLAVDCQAMVWNLNGRVPDEGAVSEAAMAWTLGRPLVAFLNDARSLIAGRINPLLVGLVDFATVEVLQELPQALRQALAVHGGPVIERPAMPDAVQSVIAKGDQLWQAMQDCGAQFDDERIADVVADLFAPPVDQEVG